MDYQQAIKRPFVDLKKFLIGIALITGAITNFFVLGYLLEAVKLTLNKKKELPIWQNLDQLFIKGLLSLIIIIIYMIPAMVVAISGIIIGVIKGLLTVGFLKENVIIGILEGLEISIPLFVIASMLILISAYLFPLALIKYATTWNFKEAFRLNEIIKKAINLKYFSAWIVSLAITIIIVAILAIGFMFDLALMMVLTQIPIIGMIVLPIGIFVIPIIGIVAGIFISEIISLTLIAQVYTEVK